MTDEQIMQGLKWCYQVEGSCGDCPYRPDEIKKAKCHDRLGNDVIDLIKRQQAEIERLKKTNPLFEYAAKSVHQYIEDGKTYYLDFVNEEYEAEAISKKIDYICNIQDIRAEAIKEFTDRLKQNLSFGKYITAEQIDNLVKEMGCGE